MYNIYIIILHYIIGYYTNIYKTIIYKTIMYIFILLNNLIKLFSFITFLTLHFPVSIQKKINLDIYFMPVLVNPERVANFNCRLFRYRILLSSTLSISVDLQSIIRIKK